MDVLQGNTILSLCVRVLLLLFVKFTSNFWEKSLSKLNLF